jgi:ribonuclease T1
MNKFNWKQLLVVLLVFIAAYLFYNFVETGSLLPGFSPAAPAQSGSSPPSATSEPARQVGQGEISVIDLPPEGRDTLALIKKGGPFPYSKDDTVFSNYEGLLPQKGKGYYHEYTVITPGSPDRGARRIVAGQGGEYYYTGDHYRSFKRIVE